MPIREYNQYFGGKKGSALKAYLEMLKKYGRVKGKEVFYAYINKKKAS